MASQVALPCAREPLRPLPTWPPLPRRVDTDLPSKESSGRFRQFTK